MNVLSPVSTADPSVVSATPACPRTLARDARRQAILDIARESFVTDGFAATSMSAIAAKLGGSKGTLYNYFRSKEELFEAIMQEACGGDEVALAAIHEGGDLHTVLHRLGRPLRPLCHRGGLGGDLPPGGGGESALPRARQAVLGEWAQADHRRPRRMALGSHAGGGAAPGRAGAGGGPSPLPVQVQPPAARDVERARSPFPTRRWRSMFRAVVEAFLHGYAPVPAG